MCARKVSCLPQEYPSNNMRRLVLQAQNRQVQENECIDVTPLRRSTVRLPRARLLDKDPQPEETLGFPASSRERSGIKAAAVSQNTRQYRQLNAKPLDPVDNRFVLRRCQYNVEAANYLLKKRITDTSDKYQLDVFSQLDSLVVDWRKKCMHELMVKENVIPGLRQKQVLRSSQLSTENKVPGSLAGQPKHLLSEGCFEDGMWKSKPRKKPLIGFMDSILDMPGFRIPDNTHRHSLIDCNSKNIIAASIEDSVTFYNTRKCNVDEVIQLENIHARILKWSHCGDLLAIGYEIYLISIFHVPTQKFLWSAKCRCDLPYNFPCVARCCCWSENDQHIIARIMSVYLVKCGTCIKTIPLPTGMLTIAFSSTYRYLVATFIDSTVRIFEWQSMTPFLDITYYKPVKAVAWHPEESGLICIGGGEGDGSLSLWNVNKMKPLGYRKVDFNGCVENLAWHKQSGELVVQWAYKCMMHGRRYTIMPVLGSLNHIVDSIPLDKEMSVGHVIWNSDYTQIGVQAGASLSIWNFHGNDFEYKRKPKDSQSKVERSRIHRHEGARGLLHFNIR